MSPALIVGLGNPGVRYADTRHNVGFVVVERMAALLGAAAFGPRFRGRLTRLALGGREVALLCPQTFMNESGLSVAPAAHALGVEPAGVLVVHDELDLPFGALKLKRSGGFGGHRGLSSIAEELGSSEFGRLRVGIGRPPANFPGSVADFVLEAFPLADRTTLDEVVERAVEGIRLYLDHGMDEAMNRVNQRPKPTLESPGQG